MVYIDVLNAKWEYCKKVIDEYYRLKEKEIEEENRLMLVKAIIVY